MNSREKIFGCCVPGTAEVEPIEYIVYKLPDGRRCIFDDPYFNPYAFNCHPFNTSPERSPVPSPKRRPPIQPEDAINLEDGLVLPKLPQHFQLAKKLREEKENINHSAAEYVNMKHADTEEDTENRLPGKKEDDTKIQPHPIEVRVQIKNPGRPVVETYERRKIPMVYTKGKKTWKRKIDKSIEPFRVMDSPRQLREDLEFNYDDSLESESPTNHEDANSELQVYMEYPEFQYLEVVKPPRPKIVPEPEPERETEPEPGEKKPSRFKKFRNFIRRLCCWRLPVEPQLEPETKPEHEPKPKPNSSVEYPSLRIDNATTLHVLRGDSETDTGVCRVIRELRLRREAVESVT